MSLPSENTAREREISNMTRIDDLSLELDKTTLLIDRGLGSPINGRRNIENTHHWL